MKNWKALLGLVFAIIAMIALFAAPPDANANATWINLSGLPAVVR